MCIRKEKSINCIRQSRKTIGRRCSNGKLPDQQRVRDYMYLSLQLLQHMRPLLTREEARTNDDFDAEPYMKAERNDR